MKLIAIDTSTKFLSVAVVRDGKVASRYHREAAMSHSRILISVMERQLKRAKVSLKDIDAFVISIGPGSFTGLRIGVTTVKTLALAMKRPVVTVPTLDAIAENIKDGGMDICVAIDAKKGKVYACLYASDGKRLKRVSGYELLPMKELMEKIKEKTVFSGDGINVYRKEIAGLGDLARLSPEREWYPRADVIARLGMEKFKKKKFADADGLAPFYIYSKECDIKGY